MTNYISPFSSRSRDKQVVICPCCGAKFAGDFNNGCLSCGARAVGEPLPLPEHQLPSYVHALLLAGMGTFTVLAFSVQFVVALVKRAPESFNLWSWAIAKKWATAFLTAGETTAWRLKWIAIPLTLLVLIAGRKTYKSILLYPARHCGRVYARRGLTAAATVCVLIAMLIGVSIPGRLRNRQDSIEASDHALGYRIDRALIEYRDQFGTYPSDVSDLNRLCDEDGSIGAALRKIDPTSYRTTADLAAVPQKKPGALRGAVIRNASLNSDIDDSPTGSLSFTNYELRLAGIDKVLGTEDDLIVRDGLITKASEAGPGIIGSTASSSAIKP
jgi:hypothetical protein